MNQVGVLRDAPNIPVRCEGIDCKGNHETYDATEVVIMDGGVDLGVAEADDTWSRCLTDGRMAATRTRAYVTMVGIWWEAVCDN